MEKSLNLVIFLVFLLSAHTKAATVYNVVNFGAKADGKTDSSRAFIRAWTSACASTKSAKISVPLGRYLINKAVFRGPCKNNATVIEIKGTLVAPSNYWALGNTGYWLLFAKVSGVSVVGGTIDAQATSFWACRAAGKVCPAGARSLTFSNANNIIIKGLTSINSQATHIVINGCKNAQVQKLKISAPDDSPNTDGIHVQNSVGVTITGTTIKTGDDCISIGPGTRNLMIDGINCGPGHGISIGSLGRDLVEAGVQDVTVKNVILTGSDNGLRIKSWARPSSGFVRGVLYQDVIMKNVRNPIIIDQHYCPHNMGCPGQESGVKISEITYKNVQGSSASQVATKFDCSVRNPCSAIKLQDIKLTYNNFPARSFCVNAAGIVRGSNLAERCL